MPLSHYNVFGSRSMQSWTSWKKIGVILVLAASCSPLRLHEGRETEHFLARGEIPLDKIESIYDVFRERIFIQTTPDERITVMIKPRLRSAGYDGKTYPDRIEMASYTDSVFIHEMAHYLWEIRGWKLRPRIKDERSRLRRRHPFVKEEFLNHYLIYDVIVPEVERLSRYSGK